MDKETFTDVTCENVSMIINQQPLLQGIDLHVGQGERVAVIGPNAAGKSTLLKLLAGEIQPTDGRVLLNNKAYQQYTHKSRARILTKVPQRVKMQSAFSVRDYVALGRYPYLKFTGRLSREDMAVVEQALRRTHLEGLAERPVQALSGGEQQRVLLAQALAQETSLLLLDEPNSYLDLSHQLSLIDLLIHLNREWGMTVITVLHDLNLAAVFAKRIILLQAGKIVGDGSPRDILTEANIQKVFGLQATRIELPGAEQQFHFSVGRLS